MTLTPFYCRATHCFVFVLHGSFLAQLFLYTIV